MNEEEKNVTENETIETAKEADAVEETEEITENEEIEEYEEKPPVKRQIIDTAYDFVEMLGAITVIIILCFSFVVRLNVVDGPSMEETLHTGEYLVVSDLFYTPTRGDIIVLQSPEASESYRKPLVKRVIATAGQTVAIEIETGNVFVDGEPVEEPYRNLPGKPSQMYGGHMTVKDGYASVTVTECHVFVMGDNRNNSADSRLNGIGLIDERCIVGKVLARVFPFDKMTTFKNPFSGT